jgi:putative nucleotidyltransferase with HDIG domain
MWSSLRTNNVAHIKAHERTVQGKLQFVHTYDDKRSGSWKRTPKRRHHHVLEVAGPGMQKMKETITGLLKTPEGLDKLEGKIKKGGFHKALPEVAGLYGLEQGSHHKYIDAFDHTMQVIRHLPPEASDTVRWAALLHDIGKLDTQKMDEHRGAVFDGHEYVGSKKVRKILARLGFSKDERDEIPYLIKNHGNLRTKLLRGDEDQAREFMSHKYFGDLLMIHVADVIASGRDPREVLEKIDKLNMNSRQSNIAKIAYLGYN